MSSDFSRTQQVALAVVPKVTASLSIIGSLWIFIEVVTQKSKRQNVYNRLLCAMSFFDITTAIWMFASTWPIPIGSEDVAFAAGNQLTCEVQGFFLQLGSTPPLYNTFLALYYLLVIKYSVPEETLRHRVEPFMHIFAIAFGLSTSGASHYMDLFNDANLWCWIASYPEDCVGEECVRGANAPLYRWVFYFIPLWICLVIVSVLMLSIYRTVRKREQQAVDDSMLARSNRRTSMIRPSWHKNSSSSFRNSLLANSMGSSLTTVPQHASTQPIQVTPRRKGRRDSYNNQTRAQRPSITPERRRSLIMPKQIADMFMMQGEGDSTSRSDSDVNYVLQAIESLPSANKQAINVNHLGSRVVFTQSMLYTCAFYTTYLFATVNRLVQQFTGKTYFPIILLHCIFIPLQGFFNVMVYRYYFYVRLQQRNPHMTFWELMHWTWRWSFLGPPPEPQSDKTESSSDMQASRVRGILTCSRSQPENDSSMLRVESMPGSSGIWSKNESWRIDSMNTSNRLESQSRFHNDRVSSSTMPAKTEQHDDYNDVNFLEDEFMGINQANSWDTFDSIAADLIMAYGEFPNSLAEETVMVTQEFPATMHRDSYSHMPTPGFENELQKFSYTQPEERHSFPSLATEERR